MSSLVTPFADHHLARKLERTEARCNAACVEARARLQPSSGATWQEIAGAYVLFDGPESPLTQTFGLGLAPVEADDLARIEAFFAERQAPVMHEISPLANAALWPLLTGRGYRPIEFSTVLYQTLDSELLAAAPASNLYTRRIEAGEAVLWARTAAEGWSSEMPGLSDFMVDFGTITASSAGSHPFLAELAGQPIAAGGLFIYDDVALLAGASTVPQGRRQGAQSALLAARLRYAATQGCTLAMMAALPGSQSQRNAEKNGFRVAYTRVKWALAAS